MAPQRWERMTDVGPRCVVGLLLVVPSSDWFWCGQVKMFRECAFQGGHSYASCALVMVPRAQPRSHSFRFPCSGTLICAPPFAAARRFALSFRGGASIHVHFFTAALLQPLKFTSGPAFPGRGGIGRINGGTAICFFVGEFCVYISWSRFLLFLLFHSLAAQYPYQVGRLGEGEEDLEEAAGGMA